MNRCVIGAACTAAACCALLAIPVGLNAEPGKSNQARYAVPQADEGAVAPDPKGKDEGGVAGIGVVCAETGVPAQCQTPSADVLYVSDAKFPVRAAERFRNDTGGAATITKLCWWGAYIDQAPAPDIDCSADPANTPDAFTITFYANDPTAACPNSVPTLIPPVLGPLVQGVGFTLAKDFTGENVFGPFMRFEYSATLLGGGLALADGDCVWVEIQNDTTGTASAQCFWYWESGAAGDSFALQTTTDYTDPLDVVDNDLALCVNMVLGDTAACNFVVDAGCVGATTPCGAPSGGTPGCVDPCCCSLVCASLPLCCLSNWTQICADAAIGNGCASPPYTCTAPGYANDCCTSPTTVVDGASVAFATANANSDGAPEGNTADCIPNGTVGKDLWYKFAAPEDGTLVASTCGNATYDTTLEIYDIGNGSYDCQDIKDQVGLVGCNDDGGYADVTISPCLLTSHVMAEVTGGTQYLVRLGGFDGLSGTGNISFDFTPGVDVFDTGLERTVTFNATANTLVGFSSGNLAPPAPALPQRRTAQAFTISPGVPQEITQLWLQGFHPVDAVNPVVNTTLTMEVFTRTALNVAPTPADQIALRTIPYPASFLEPTINLLDSNVRHLFSVTPTFTLNPGNYWLTVYAGNTQPGVVQSNFAWFTNAPNGINNSCPLLGVQGCGGNTGCTGQPGGTQAMWRSCTYPTQGFVAYFTAAIALDPAGCPLCIPADLLNTSFRIRGRAAAACVGDCFQPPNGVVDTQDFLALLAAWGPPGGFGPCDIDNNGTVDTIDFLALLGNWGLCP